MKRSRSAHLKYSRSSSSSALISSRNRQGSGGRGAGGRETAQTTGKRSTPEKQTDWHFLRENKQWQVIRVIRCLPFFTPTSVDFFWKVGQCFCFCVCVSSRLCGGKLLLDWFGAVCYGLSSHWPPFISLFLTHLYLLYNKFYQDTSPLSFFYFKAAQWIFQWSLRFWLLLNKPQCVRINKQIPETITYSVKAAKVHPGQLCFIYFFHFMPVNARP